MLRGGIDAQYASCHNEKTNRRTGGKVICCCSRFAPKASTHTILSVQFIFIKFWYNHNYNVCKAFVVLKLLISIILWKQQNHNIIIIVITIGNATSLWHGLSVVGRLVCRSVIISQMGGRLHFNAPIGALVIALDNNDISLLISSTSSS